MNKIVQNSIKSEILLALSEINQENNELLQFLERLNEGFLQNSPQLSERLESMKSEIKDKVRLISTNFQELYKIIDCKIMKIIRQLKENPLDG